MKRTIVSVLCACLFCSLLTLALIETALETPYAAAKTFLRAAILSETIQDQSLENSKDNCTIARTTDISPGSTLVIGHAYGSPRGTGEFISQAVEKLILKHAASLDAVIFSGDVFKVPSVAKWKRLKALSEKTATKFYVAPGNHDVGFGDNARRDVWNLSGYSLNDSAVKRINLSGFSIILEDSVIANWQLKPTVLKALNHSVSDDPTLLVRHHIAVKEMLPMANSQ